MAKPVRIGAKVQAWMDREHVVHAVAMKSEPHRLLCKPTQMWGYHPKLYPEKYVNCPGCRKELDSDHSSR